MSENNHLNLTVNSSCGTSYYCSRLFILKTLNMHHDILLTTHYLASYI